MRNTGGTGDAGAVCDLSLQYELCNEALSGAKLAEHTGDDEAKESSQSVSVIGSEFFGNTLEDGRVIYKQDLAIPRQGKAEAGVLEKTLLAEREF